MFKLYVPNKKVSVETFERFLQNDLKKRRKKILEICHKNE